MLLSIAEQTFQCCLDKTSALPPSLLDSVALSVALAACSKPYASRLWPFGVTFTSWKYQFCFSSSKAQWSLPISTPCFMNFHTSACLSDKLDLFLLKKCVFPLPSSSWQSSPPSHQATVISVFLGCLCKFAERKECAVPGDYLCWVGCNHRVRKDCYRHRSKETWQ